MFCHWLSSTVHCLVTASFQMLLLKTRLQIMEDFGLEVRRVRCLAAFGSGRCLALGQRWCVVCGGCQQIDL